LEELLSKDNETVPLPLLTSDSASASPGLQSFTPDQLIACESCLRTNAPTRANCLYCGANLPVHNGIADLRQPALRPLEDWEQGYNNILKSSAATETQRSSEQVIAAAGDLVKLDTAAIARIISANHALPLARSATRDEASLVQRRLKDLGIETDIVADVNLAAEGAGPLRVRGVEINENGLSVYERPGAQPFHLLWSEILLMLVGRLTVQRVELREEKASRKQNRVLDSSEFFTDETVFDFYAASNRSFRIMAKSFDFSCLGPNKGLMAEQNMLTLLALFREKATGARWDDSFNSVKKELELVWPSERRAESAGWRRDRPGKITKGSVTKISNESQFQKYSRLCHHLMFRAPRTADEES
jgi:hypothetical protein